MSNGLILLPPGVRELQQVHRCHGHHQEDEGGLSKHGDRDGQAGG